jgi:hypothetical protein
MSEDREYHQKVMRLAVKVNTFLTEQGEPFDVQINAVLTVLALAGTMSDLEQEEFVGIIAVQLDDLMTRMGDRPEFVN